MSKIETQKKSKITAQSSSQYLIQETTKQSPLIAEASLPKINSEYEYKEILNEMISILDYTRTENFSRDFIAEKITNMPRRLTLDNTTQNSLDSIIKTIDRLFQRIEIYNSITEEKPTDQTLKSYQHNEKRLERVETLFNKILDLQSNETKVFFDTIMNSLSEETNLSSAYTELKLREADMLESLEDAQAV